MATLWGAAIILGAGTIAYVNSLQAPFVFDDIRTIVENPSLAQVWAITRDGSPAAGRPLVHATLALNRAMGGFAVEGYHVFNLAVHLCAGLVLFGIVRRTLQPPRWAHGFEASADGLAALAAALWTVHPLQTESVTYVVQRAESLCGLFYLLTLYCFIRGTADGAAESPSGAAAGRRQGAWLMLAVVACLAGALSKEVIVTAPLLVLLYDRTFVAGSFREAWRRHGRVHVALFATWGLLGWLVAQSGNRSGSAGFNAGVAWWEYGFTQFPALLHYLRLAFWPVPLVFDYGTGVVRNFASIWPAALAVGALAIATVLALWRRPVPGFFGAGFFLMLAPSSSVVPVVTQTTAEHRMYLPLAALVVGGVILLHAWLGRRSAWIVAGLIVAAAALTVRRNQDYASAISLWGGAAAQAPTNARAHYNLGIALLAADRQAEAGESFAAAVRERPDYALARDALGSALLAQGRTTEAVVQFEEAVRLQPGFVAARVNLGASYRQAGRPEAAAVQYEAALAHEPAAADAHFNLASVLAARGDALAAIPHYEAALRAKPDLVDARYGLANALARTGQLPAALLGYQTLVAERPDDARARTNLGNVHLLLGHFREAIAAYEKALQLDPHDENARSYLEQARELRRREEAIR